MDANNIEVIGSGTMGSGIAQVFAGSGIEVLLTDINDAAVQRGVATVSKDVTCAIARKMAKSNPEATWKRL